MTLVALVMGYEPLTPTLDCATQLAEQEALYALLLRLDTRLQQLIADQEDTRGPEITAGLVALGAGQGATAAQHSALHTARLRAEGRLLRLCGPGMADAWESRVTWESFGKTDAPERRAGDLGLVIYGLYRELWLLSAGELAGSGEDLRLWARRLSEAGEHVANAMMRSSTVFPCFDGCEGRTFIGEGWLPTTGKVREFARNLPASASYRSDATRHLIAPLQKSLVDLAQMLDLLADLHEPPVLR